VFDAGAIMAHLDVETSLFDRKLTAAEERVKTFERGKHEVRISAVFENASLGRARQVFTQLDQQLSREAMQRLRSSPQGSVLGALNALFSPHPVTGGPSPQQAASQGLLGRVVRSQGGGAGMGASSILLNQAAGSGTGRVRLDQASISDLASAIGNQLPDTPAAPAGGSGDNARRAAEASQAAASDSADAARASARAASSSDSSHRSLLRMFGIGGGGGGGGGIGFLGRGGGGRDRGGTGFVAGHLGPFSAGLASGIGPGILGIGGIKAAIAGAIGTGVAALPALAAGGGALGVLGAGAGIIGAGAKTLIGSKNTKQDPNAQGPLYAQAQQIAKVFQDTMRQAAGGMLAPLKQAFNQIPGLLRGIAPLLRQVFAGAGTLIEPLLKSLNDIAHMVLPEFAQALRATAPLVRPLLDGFGRLVAGILPGLVTLLRAARPAIDALASGLAMIGSGLGTMFSQFAPVIRASATILKALLDVVAALFPIIGSLAGVFARTLAPIFVTLAGIIKSLLPFLTTLGKLFADLAGAILGDLVAAFGAVAQLLKAISPALNAFAQAFSGVFTVLENSGVFAIIGDALEALVKPLATMINALLHGLTPLLPPLIKFFGQLGQILITGLSQAIIALLPPLTQLGLVVLKAIAQLLPILLPLFISLTTILTAAFVRVVQDLATALSWVIKSIPPKALRDIALGFIAIWAAIKVGGLIATVSNPITLIAAAIGLLIVGIVELATHWNTVWSHIKQWTGDAWHFLQGVFRNHIVQDILAVWSLGLIPLAEHWQSVWHNIQHWTDNVRIWLHQTFGTDIANFFTRTIPGWLHTLLGGFTQFWDNTKSGFRGLMHWFHQTFGTDISNFFTQTVPHVFQTAVSKIGQFWSSIVGKIETPVKAVFTHVLDPLASGFDWITSHLGLGRPIPVPLVKGWTRGGKITGGTKGKDSVLGLLEPDEVVIPTHMVHAGMIDHLRGLLPGFQAGGRAGQGQAAPFNIHTGVSTSGPTGSPFSLSSILHKIMDMGRISAALATGNSKALINAFSDFTGIKISGAGGDVARIIAAVPKIIVKDLANWLFGKAGGGSGNAIVQDAMRWLGKIPYVWGGTSVPGGADCSGFVQAIYGRHGISAPRTSEAQGAWVKRGGAVPGGLAFYNSPAGGPPPGHVAIVKDGSMVISQGGGMGPQLMPLTGALPLMFTGIPPHGFNSLKGIVAKGPLQAYARKLVDATWNDAQWPPFADIVSRESNWVVTATNPGSGAYGIPQALPGSKMASAGADWRTNGYTQLRWMVNYIKGKWGTPENADFNEQINHWYNKGGPIREPVIGFGQVTGDRYHFAENGPEWVTPMGPGGHTPAAIGNVFIQLPEGGTVARALNDINFWLSVSRQQGWAGGMPGG
jgi:phage-related protein